MHDSIKEALSALSEYSVNRRFPSIYNPNPLQKLIMVLRWFISDQKGEFLDIKATADAWGMSRSTLLNYVNGLRS